MPGATIKDCLATIGVSSNGLSSCSGLREEWAFIKKTYFKTILKCHPDKGGDAAVFRETLAAFDVLRELIEKDVVRSFASESAQSTANAYKDSKDDLRNMSTPSWEFYAEAAKEAYATYRVELARSNRARCMARGTARCCDDKKPFIEKGSLRIGFMMETGGYGRWVHIGCWRVPSKIWLGLPDPAKTRDSRKFEAAMLRMNEVTLCGVSELKAGDRKKLSRYVMDKKRWSFGGVAEKVRRKPTDASARGASSGDAKSAKIVVAAPERKNFIMPVPGKGGLADSLAGKNVVVTGTFPEVGGGQGFNVGKDRLKKMIVSFGGKVSTAISGKTNVLVVGKLPGSSKVAKARANKKITMLDLHGLKSAVERGSLEGSKASKKMVIKDFGGFGRRKKSAATPALKNKAAPGAKKSMKAMKETKKRKTASAGSLAKKRRA